MFSKKSMLLLTIFFVFVSLVPSPASAANILFYNNNGIGAVGHIDSSGKFQQTESISDFSSSWSQIVPVGSNLLFYKDDGTGAVGHIDNSGKFQQTESISDFSSGWSQIISTK
jgi:hypothetical protein